MGKGQISDDDAKAAQSLVDQYRERIKGMPSFGGKFTLPAPVQDPKLTVAKAHLKVAKGTEVSIAQLVELTNVNVALAQLSVKASDSAARFSRVVAFVSGGIAIASLAVAVASLVVALSK